MSGRTGEVARLDLRNHIVQEIRRIAKESDGQAPGVAAFEREAGIKPHEWQGKYWSKWSDALAEAGFESNEFSKSYSDEFILRAFAQIVRDLGKVPTRAEVQLVRQRIVALPNDKVIWKRFGGKAALLQRFREFCTTNSEFTDLLLVLGDFDPETVSAQNGQHSTDDADGFVYLLKSGAHFKIGRSEEIERRVKQISVSLPDATTLVHAIRTDDPSGIEDYWHRRFADRRANGEWFRLTPKDVAAFKKRRFQ
jgi:hypothetical protein